MSSVKVRDMILGEGLPKICVPLTDKNLNDLKKSIDRMRNMPFDLIEWRADFYEGTENFESCAEAMSLLRSELENTPVLFTIRTCREGGMMEIDTEIYVKILLSVIESGLVDMVDVELSRGADTMRTIVNAAHQSGVKVIASCHDFACTPAKHTIVETLCQMQKLGADVAKFAVMPQSERDVLTLLDATLTMKEEHNETPVITMSMGRLGAVSRICGSTFGSAVTFGTVGNASAPGQLPADLLMSFLESLG